MSTQIDETLTLEQKAQHKLKQLTEACNLLEDLEWRVSWALDFSQYESINEILNPLTCNLSDALSEMEDIRDQLEEEIESYKNDKAFAEIDFDKNSNLAYSLK